MARKSLRKRLMESQVRSGAQESAKRLAQFLEYWGEAEKAFREGWVYKDVWRILKQDGDIDFSYSAFLHYIRKVRKRRLDHEREKEREKERGTPGEAVIAAVRRGRPALRTRTPKPGSTKVELPRFGQEAKPRDPKSF